MGNQITMFNTRSGKELRDDGIKRAADHANAKIQTWSNRAYDCFVNYARSHELFMTEDVRAAAEIPAPPSNRAWGSVAVRAKKANIIAHAGYKAVKNPKAHCAPCNVWRSLIYKP